MKMETKVAEKWPPLEPATKKSKSHNQTYRKVAPLSSTKEKLLIEIRGLLGSLDNSFLSQAEKETCERLFYSTVRKLIVLQNGYCGCVESKDSERPE